MSNTNTTTPTRSTEPTAPKYEVPDSIEAWERFNRLVGEVFAPSERITADEDNQSTETNPAEKH